MQTRDRPLEQTFASERERNEKLLKDCECSWRKSRHIRWYAQNWIVNESQEKEKETRVITFGCTIVENFHASVISTNGFSSHITFFSKQTSTLGNNTREQFFATTSKRMDKSFQESKRTWTKSIKIRISAQLGVVNGSGKGRKSPW